MFQFNRYKHPDEASEVHAGLHALCSHYEYFRDHIFMAHRGLSLLERYPESLKLILVNLRLQLWCRGGAESCHLAVHELPRGLRIALERRLASPLAHFAQQEIWGILGEGGVLELSPRGAGLETAGRIHARTLAFSANQPMELGERSEAAFAERPPVYFLPATSGFFSTLENVLLMAYYAKVSGAHLVLAPERYWWRYGIGFETIFPELFDIADESQVDTVQWYTRDSAADWLAGVGPDVQAGFFDYKCQRYPKIFDAIDVFVRDVLGESALHADGFVLFLRGGDKYSQETVPFPHWLVESVVTRGLAQYGRIHILSDDWRLAEALSVGYEGAENITQASSQGHQFLNHVTADDVMKILHNFRVLCTCKLSAGCPSSNLVNAANIYRLATGRAVSASRLFPVHNYLLL